MAMVKLVHVTLKVASEWGLHVSDTLDISEQTSNSPSQWSTKNNQSSWSYELIYALSYVVRKPRMNFSHDSIGRGAIQAQ